MMLHQQSFTGWMSSCVGGVCVHLCMLFYVSACVFLPACLCPCVCVYVCARECVCIIYVWERKSKENIINDHMIIRKGNEGPVPPLRQDNRLQDIPDYVLLTPAAPHSYSWDTTTQRHYSARHACRTASVILLVYYSPITVILSLDHFTDIQLLDCFSYWTAMHLHWNTITIYHYTTTLKL